MPFFPNRRPRPFTIAAVGADPDCELTAGFRVALSLMERRIPRVRLVVLPADVVSRVAAKGVDAADLAPSANERARLARELLDTVDLAVIFRLRHLEDRASRDSLRVCAAFGIDVLVWPPGAESRGRGRRPTPEMTLEHAEDAARLAEACVRAYRQRLRRHAMEGHAVRTPVRPIGVVVPAREGATPTERHLRLVRGEADASG